MIPDERPPASEAGEAGDARELRRLEAALRATEGRFQALAEAMPQIVCALRPDGTPEYVNAAWTEYSGLSFEETARAGWLGVVHPEDVPALLDCWKRARARGAAEQVELRYRSAAGAYRWFLSRLAPVRDSEGGTVRWVGAGVDIDDRKRSETEREALLASLTEADRRKDAFLALLSHELRNPLAALATAAAILDRAAPAGAEATLAKDVIARQVGHLGRLVDDLLDVTRISRGKIQLRPAPLELRGLVAHVVEDHRSTYAACGVALHAPGAGEALWVDADATRIAQVIGNLLGNAAKFSEAGGEVTVTCGEEDGRAVVRVADRGVGIAPPLLARVFEPFVQAEDTLHRARGGLGLGLALVKGLVEEHGGTVEAGSAGPLRGSTFTIRLPLRAPPEAPPPARSRFEAGAPPARRRVLVVEDDRDAADTLRMLLELAGHEVAIARDGDEGIDRARALRPDVVLCDIGLPGKDGYAVARALRASPELAGTTLVALTGYALPDDRRRAAEAGFDAHLGKPAAAEEIERVLLVAGEKRGAGA